MKKERILSYQLSQKISEQEVDSVSAAGGWSYHGSGQGTYGSGGVDGGLDASWDW